MAYSYKGAIAFGLVYIPITLSVTVKNNDIGFNMIEKKTMSRVKYKKTCVDCNNKEINNEDIVKGYQVETINISTLFLNFMQAAYKQNSRYKSSY